MPIQIRLMSDEAENLIAVSQQLGTCLGDRVEMNRLRDGGAAAGIVYGMWWLSAPDPAAATARSRGTWPTAMEPILVRLISSSLEELTAASQKLALCLDGELEISSARDSRNGEWLIYGTWTPRPRPPAPAREPARRAEGPPPGLRPAYS